jgi:hypothetical protein
MPKRQKCTGLASRNTTYLKNSWLIAVVSDMLATILGGDVMLLKTGNAASSFNQFIDRRNK